MDTLPLEKAPNCEISNTSGSFGNFYTETKAGKGVLIVPRYLYATSVA